MPRDGGHRRHAVVRSGIKPDPGWMRAGAGFDLSHLIDFVRRHERLFVLTGAGCSTASGIPDYRDGDGQWKHAKPVMYQDFLRSETVRQRYWARSVLGWPKIAHARPNRAHHALARLEAAGYVHQLVTQNVDGLHYRAGSRRLVDLHGRLHKVVCLQCGRCCSRESLQTRLRRMNPDLRRIGATLAPDGDADLDAVCVAVRVPSCSACGGILKPAVTFFGEAVPRARVEFAYARLEESDAVLVVGSSLMVYSGYRFCRAASEHGKPLAAINLGRTRVDHALTVKLRGDCGGVLTALARRLGAAYPP